MLGAILQRIACLTQPASPPEPWSFLSRASSMRKLSTDASELVESLGQEFTQEQLESARVLVRGRDGELGLSPILAGEARRGLFLRRNKSELPFDFVNLQGALASDDPPAFASCRDLFTRSWSGKAKVILVAFSDDDPLSPNAGTDLTSNRFLDKQGM